MSEKRIVPGSPEYIRIHGEVAAMAAPDRNCLSFWFPPIRDAGLLVPETFMVEYEGDLLGLLDGVKPDDFDSFVDVLAEYAERVGYPFFLRTGHGSGKHDWDETCFVGSRSEIGRHVARLVEWSFGVDMVGLPTSMWAVRKMIETAPLFTAFWGHMPITREFRLFVRDNAVEHVQPYWPPDAIIAPSDLGWRTKLEQANRLTWGERKILADVAVIATAAVGGGFWSVDFLQDKSGSWWLTDMADGDRSFRWDDTP